jgi:hypothetical protein
VTALRSCQLSSKTKLEPFLRGPSRERAAIRRRQLVYASRRQSYFNSSKRRLAGTRSLRGLVVHLSEGANTDSSAHREYSMLSKEVLLGGKDGKAPINREGLVLIHGTALRDLDFARMKSSGVGLIWSPRSNDELYGSTTNIVAARQADVQIAIAPDWSPSGSAGMLQEIGYVSRHYGAIGSSDLVAMATSVPAKLVRVSDDIGVLSPGKLADFIVVNVNVDPTKSAPLDPVAKATPADISLVVVDGKPLYGNKALLNQLLPTGAETDVLRVCGAEKAVYLGDTEAGNRHWTLNDIKLSLHEALAPAGSVLSEIRTGAGEIAWATSRPAIGGLSPTALRRAIERLRSEVDEAATRQNASTTSAFRHECCTRVLLMFATCVISNSCASQK